MATPTFDPTSISGLKLWLDAADSLTLFQNSNGTAAVTADGDPVGYWGDKSGNNRHATQTDGTKKLTRSATNRCLTSDGVNDFLQTSITGLTAQPFTYFVTFKPLQVSGRTYRIFSGTVNYSNFDIFQYPGPVFGGYAGYPYGVYGGIAVANTKYMCKIEFNSSSSTIVYNGNLITGNAGTDYPTVFQVAQCANFTDNGNCDYYEILVYNSLLSSANSTLVINYLNSKWSIY